MAVVTSTEAKLPPRLDLYESVLVTWAGLANGDTGAPVELTEFPDRTVQIGTGAESFGGGTMVLEGSLDGVTYFTLKDPFGSSISTLVNALATVLELTRYVRPSLSGGAAGSVTVRLLLRRARGRGL